MGIYIEGSPGHIISKQINEALEYCSEGDSLDSDDVADNILHLLDKAGFIIEEKPDVRSDKNEKT